MPAVETVQKYGLHSDVHGSFPLGEETEAVLLSQNITLPQHQHWRGLCGASSHLASSLGCAGQVVSVALCLTLCDRMNRSPPGSILCPWDSPGKNAGVGHHALLQGILPT